MTIDVTVGRVQVLHRLALGVVPVDGVTGRQAASPVRVRREVPRRHRRPRSASDLLPKAPGVDLERNGTAGFKLRHGPGVGGRVVIRIDDARRRWVCRRFEVELWSRAEVEAADADPPQGPYLPAAGRLLRPWLLPGPAAGPPRGSSGITGRLLRGGKPVRWARVVAHEGGGEVVGWAHGDERGEFLLVVTRAGALPTAAPATLELTLDVFVPDPSVPTTVDPRDPAADLVVESVAKVVGQPLPDSPEHEVLTGRSIPDTYVPGLSRNESVVTGEVLALNDIPLS